MKKLVCSLFAATMLFGAAAYAVEPVYYEEVPVVARGTSAGLNWTSAAVAVPIVIAIIAGVAAGDDDHSVHSHS